jgi:hypothetical protein
MAVIAALVLSSKTGDQWEPYRCWLGCRGWHLDPLATELQPTGGGRHRRR